MHEVYTSSLESVRGTAAAGNCTSKMWLFKMPQVVANFHTIRDHDICFGLVQSVCAVLLSANVLFELSVSNLRNISVSFALFFSPSFAVNRH